MRRTFRILAALLLLAASAGPAIGADGFIIVPPDSTGKSVDHSSLIVAGNTVFRQRFNLCDPTNAAGCAAVDALLGLSVNVKNSTLAVTQSGLWNIGFTGSLPAGTALLGGVELYDGGGVNKAAIDASGALAGNVTKFGGTALSTGTGVGGLGIPRVTVSSDSFPATQPVSGTVAVSNFPATQPVSGTVTANAGTGTFTTSDTHFPASAALSDAISNPTVTLFGAPMLLWDATNTVWRRAQADAGTGTLKVDPGTVAVTGTFFQATQPVSGTVTANQGGAPWTVTGTGTAGTAAAGVVTIQGIASMTAVKVDGSAVTQPVSGTVTTSPPANASSNVAQINGVTPLMGNGVTGTGSPRVTIASDNTAFSVNAAQSGTWTVTTTPPANASTNLAQVGGAAVSLGSKASASSIPIVPASDWVDQDVATAATALGALNAAVSVAMAGRNSVGMFLAAGTLIGTIVPEISYDGGTTWVATVFVDPTAGAFAYSASVVFAGSNTATSLSIKAGGGVTNARVRVSAFTSGTANCTVRATQNEVGTITIQGKPFVALGYYQVSGRTPTYAGLAASAPLVALRNPSATVLIVPLRVKVQVMTTVAASTAGAAQRELVIGRSWTVSDTGTAVTLTGNNNKKRTSQATSIADLKFGGALTAGTRTLDANAIGQAIAWQPLLMVGAMIGNTGATATGAASAGIGTMGGVDLLDRRSFDEYPVVLAQNEGILIRLGPDAQAAGATNQTYFDIAWAEVTAY
jgi:hypothetical protein